MWGEKDLNLRRRSRQIYSLLPLAARASPRSVARIVPIKGALALRILSATKTGEVVGG